MLGRHQFSFIQQHLPYLFENRRTPFSSGRPNLFAGKRAVGRGVPQIFVGFSNGRLKGLFPLAIALLELVLIQLFRVDTVVSRILLQAVHGKHGTRQIMKAFFGLLGRSTLGS